MSRALSLVVLVTMIISLVIIWFYPTKGDFMAGNAFWNGMRKFSNEFGAKSLESLANLTSPPEETVLIAIPYVDYYEEDLSTIKRFINKGGTLLLLDDYGYGNSILGYLGTDIRFTNVPLLDPLFSYKNQWMPRITDFSPELKERGMKVLMFNNSTSLINVAASEALAWSSRASFLDTNENGNWNRDELKGPFPVAAQFPLGEGKAILISDASIIINSMVGRDNNYDFIKYLTGYYNLSKRIVIDSSHLAWAPLDLSKARIALARRTLSNPYVLIGMVAAIFFAAYRYTLKGGRSSV